LVFFGKPKTAKARLRNGKSWKKLEKYNLFRSTATHIKELFKDVLFENLDFEFKSRLDKERTINWGKSLAAFANGDGGTIFIGADNDGIIGGLTYDEVDQTKLLIHQENERHMLSLVKCHFQPKSIGKMQKRFVLAVEIESADEMIVYDNGDYNKIVFIRKDGQSVPGSPQEIVEVSSRKKGAGFDRNVLDSYYQRDNFSSFFKACEKYRGDRQRPEDKAFVDAGVIREDGRLTFGASLFEDNCKEKNTTIFCRFYAGFDKAGAVIDKGEYLGNLIGGYDFMESFIKKNIRHGFRKEPSGGQEDIISYPSTSLDEALINALAHRDYSISGTQIDVNIFSDRLEISSPGSCLLSKEADQYDWNHIPSIRRNLAVCEMFSLAGLMEKGGTGFLQMQKDYQSHPDKHPAFHDYRDFSVLTLFDLSFIEMDIAETNAKPNHGQVVFDKLEGYRPYDEAVLILCYNAPKSRAEIQKLTSYQSPKGVIENVISPLLKAGLLISTSPGRASNQKYFTNKDKVKK
jgi:ATP-dependent DNA helicase RecG